MKSAQITHLQLEVEHLLCKRFDRDQFYIEHPDPAMAGIIIQINYPLTKDQLRALFDISEKHGVSLDFSPEKETGLEIIMESDENGGFLEDVLTPQAIHDIFSQPVDATRTKRDAFLSVIAKDNYDTLPYVKMFLMCEQEALKAAKTKKPSR